MKKKSLIFGITGQDGILLSKLLLKKKHRVFGLYRNVLKKKYIDKKVKLIFNKRLTKKIIEENIKKINPNEIYFLIGQSSSFDSLKTPNEALNTNFTIFVNIIEYCIKYKIKPNIFYASSAEVYGNNPKKIDEKTIKNPKNPYSLSKYLAMIYIDYIRKFYKLNISIGILFNHSSEYRPKESFLKKIIIYINKGRFLKKLALGNIDIYRDLGLAQEYVVAMYKIVQQKKPNDYIIATEKLVSLRSLVKYAFSLKGMNYENHIRINKLKFSNKEILFSSADTSKIRRNLQWKPSGNIKDLIKKEIIKNENISKSKK